MRKDGLIISLLIIITAVIASGAGFFAGKTLNNSTAHKAISPDILALTSPIKQIQGKVLKIENKKISLLYFNPTLMGPDINRSDYFSQNLTYNIIPTANTVYSRFSLPSIISANITVPEFSDIKIGDFITVTTSSDLRTLTKPEFKADNIMLLPPAINLTGTLTNIQENSLIVRGKAIIPLIPGIPPNFDPYLDNTDKTYKVELLSNTEIFRINQTVNTSAALPPIVSNEQLNVSNLQTGMNVNIYTNQDVTNNATVTAKRIEVLSQNNPVSATSSPTPQTRF